MMGEAATSGDVATAAARLAGVAHRTPVVTSRTLDERTGGGAYLKCEQFQRGGAFKFRGAYNRLAQLDGAGRLGGAVAYSSGNHAQGVALAARVLGISATIVMPADAPAAKLAATRGYGARVVLYDRATEDRDALARAVADDLGATLVPPFDDPDIIAGQGTVARELLEDVPDLDALLVCVGGGGLLAGCALAAEAVRPDLELWGVEPAAGDDFARSLHAGRRIEIAVPETIADGMRTTTPGRLTYPIVARRCAGIVTVTDDELRAAMRFAFERLKLILEPSGAAALAALLGGKIRARGRRIGVTLSGGNVDPASFAAAIER